MTLPKKKSKSWKMMVSNGLYDLSTVKELLQLSKDDITLYIHNFIEYFSKYSQPGKGIERKFTIDDVSKLAYISFYWESYPDMESIKIGLNREEYLEYPFSNIYFELTPIIREDFENINAESDNFIFFNRSIYNSNFELAKEYLLAAKLLLTDAKNQLEPWKKTFPILFNLRHAIELYLKALIKKDMTNTHDLKIIYTRLRFETDLDFGKQFSNLILTLDQYDKSTSFRYRNKNAPYDEKVLDVNLTFQLIAHFEKVIENYSKYYKIQNSR